MDSDPMPSNALGSKASIPAWAHIAISFGLLTAAALLDFYEPFGRSWSTLYLCVIAYAGLSLRGHAELLFYLAVLLTVFLLPVLLQHEMIWQGSGLFNRMMGVIAGTVIVTFMWDRRRFIAALQRANDELEQKVVARTSDLQNINESLRQEIAERKNAEDSLRESEERYRVLIDCAPVGLYVNQKNRFAYVNDTMCHLLGANSKDQLLGTSTLDRFPAEILPVILDRIDRIINHGETAPLMQHRYLRFDGSTIDVEATAIPVQFDHQPAIQVVINDITERKRAEEQLSATEKRLATIFDACPVGLCITAVHDGKVLEANDVCCEIAGYSREEVIGHSAIELDFWLISDERQGFVQDFMKRGSVRSDEFAFRRKDGTIGHTVRSVERMTLDGQDCFLSMFIDISERKQAEETLQMMRFSVDKAGDSVFWVSREGKILYVNDAACVDRGYTREELLNMTIFDLNVEPDFQPGRWEVHFEDLKRRGSRMFETRHRAKDGRVFPIEITANYIQIGDKEFSLGFIRNITERKWAEDERRKLQAQILHSQKLESLGVLAGGIAHDFNNLLTSVMGYSSLALMEVSHDSSIRPMLGEIEKASQRAADLTNQMLAYSGKGRFVIQPLRLDTLIKEMIQLLQTVVSKKAKAVLDLRPATIEGDASQIRQVVMNLITNASDALGDQSGEIRLRSGIRNLDAEDLRSPFVPDDLPAGAYAFVEIEDSGCGMNEETLCKIFDPFFTTKFTGRGLGLAAVLGIVRGHGGTIKVSSVSGQGTVFEVLFPCSTKEESQVFDSDKLRHPLGQGTVLIVEDEPSVRRFIQRMLQSAGFSAITAEDGQEGLETFIHHSHEIAAVLLDLKMPRMDGIEVLREMRRITAKVPILVMSGYSEQEFSMSCLKTGANGFIQKPFVPGDLIARICELLPSNAITENQ